MADDLLLEFDFSVQFYTQPTTVEIGQNCNTLMIVNLGATITTVNNYPLNPTLVPGAAGEAIAISGNRGEVFKRKTIDLGFPTGTGRVAIIQKYYVNLCK